MCETIAIIAHRLKHIISKLPQELTLLSFLMSRLDFIKLLVGIAMLMVVTSAVGKVRPLHDGRMLIAGLGELMADGVWRLQRAFSIAGSSALIYSLRQIYDTGTADFMAEFYRQSATGISIHDAFYSTRNEHLNQDTAKKKVWSAFILIE
ncbi:MAG: CHAT domain-containing protein [Muribaculaceae bacterium]|nr:CHAT domain-containing protein [Muribaculaceae bacterium]